jgi:hypothetical protein
MKRAQLTWLRHSKVRKAKLSKLKQDRMTRTELIVNDLLTGEYTCGQLATKYAVSKQYIQQISVAREAPLPGARPRPPKPRKHITRVYDIDAVVAQLRALQATDAEIDEIIQSLK